MSEPTTNLTCTDCRYYRHDHCEWARENFAPAWVNQSQVVSPDTGAECDCWEDSDDPH